MPRGSRKALSGRTRRDAVVEEVLEALERLLASGAPFATLKVQEICDEAGVAKSAFYVNFQSKTVALRRLMEMATAELFEASLAWIEGVGGSFDELVETQALSVRVWRRHAPVITAYFSAAHADRELAEFWQTQMSELVDAMQARLETAQRAGDASTVLDAGVAAAMIVQGAERVTALHVATQPAERDHELARGVAAAVWTMLGCA